MRLRHYWVIGWRNLRKYWIGNLLSLAGLVVGFALAMVVGVRFWEAWSADHGVSDVERIFYIEQQIVRTDGGINEMQNFPVKLIGSVEESLTGIEQLVWSSYDQGSYLPEEGPARQMMLTISSGHASWSDTDGKLVAGNMEEVVNSGDKISMSVRQAETLFGTSDAIGKSLLLKNRFGERIYTVAALFEDQSNDNRGQNFWFAGLSGTIGMADGDLEKMYQGWAQIIARVKLEAGQNPEDFENQLTDWVNSKEPVSDWMKERNFKLVPYKGRALKWLTSDSALERTIGLYVSAGLMLLVAVINFAALNSAIASSRVREMALRKVVGASKRNLMIQYIGEMILLVSLAYFISLIVATGLDTWLSSLIADYTIFFRIQNLPAFAIGWVVAFFAGLVAGTLSIYQITGVKTASLLNASQKAVTGGKLSRKIFVGGQAIIGFGMIFAALTIWQQNDYVMTLDRGYDEQNLLILELPWNNQRLDVSAARYSMALEFEKIDGVKSLSFTPFTPDRSWMSGTLVHPFTGEKVDIARMNIGDNYLTTIGMELLAGSVPHSPPIMSRTAIEERNKKRKEVGREIVTPVAVTENFWQDMGFENRESILNQCIYRYTAEELEQLDRLQICYQIKGVVADITSYSWDGEPITRPFLFVVSHQYAGKILIRFDRSALSKVITRIEQVWFERMPDVPMNLSFFDDNMATLFRERKSLSTLYLMSALGSLILTISGLYSLARFMVAKRRREIAIRKVLGASQMSILLLMLRQFVTPLVIGGAVGLPIAWYMVGEWLEKFEIRITPEWWWPVAVGIICTILFLACVTTEILRALRIRPAEALHYE